VPIEETKTSNELAAERTDLATERTLMAADRSLMAWIRTALSLISFGFTIYKILQGFQASGVRAVQDYSPRTIGLFLTGLGTVSIALGVVEYHQHIKMLRKHQHIKTLRPTLLVALIMAVTGLFFFISIVTRLL
jgi:putative membrane protein